MGKGLAKKKCSERKTTKNKPVSSRYPILCINSGSSSLKFALYKLESGKETLLAEGAVEPIGLDGGRLRLRNAAKDVLADMPGKFSGHKAAIKAVFGALENLRFPRPSGVGHRLVHGGPDHASPARVDPELLDVLRKLIPLAPLHLPNEIMAIEAVATHFPGLPQVACFDTAFHRRMPELSERFPLPRNLWDEGVRRYGFHGISYEYIMDVLGKEASGRLIIAHLGNGASMVAVKDGRPLDTTMGFSPTGGFMMGTRSGDIDPGVLLYLMNEKKYDPGKIEHLVDHEAGLLGVSEISPDMKTLLDMRENEPRAAQAVEMFCYHLRKHIGALAAVLEGIDTLVFTGGIGEKAAPVRQSVCEGLTHLGIRLDAGLNNVHASVITTNSSPCVVRVIPTNEDLIIARHTRNLLEGT
jgi:acetate kinase